MTPCREIPTQASAGRVANPEFIEQSRIMQSTLAEISYGFWVVLELLTIESSRLFQHCGGID